MPEKCEECGVKLGKDVHRRDINGRQRAFCCTHCADSHEKRTASHLHQ